MQANHHASQEERCCRLRLGLGVRVKVSVKVSAQTPHRSLVKVSAQTPNPNRNLNLCRDLCEAGHLAFLVRAGRSRS